MNPSLRVTLGAAAVALLGLSVGAGHAVAASLITSADIKDHTIKGVDVAKPALDSFQRLEGYEIVSEHEQVATGELAMLTAHCPGNKHVLSAGAYLFVPLTGVSSQGVPVVIDSVGATATARNVDADATLTVQIVCATA